MGKPTPEQRAESKRRARDRRVLIAGLWIAVEVPCEKHGQKWVNEFYGCQCAPCRTAAVYNDPDCRAELRRRWLARRRWVDGAWVATHLPDWQHGTPSASDYYGCGCPVCTDAARERRHRRTRRSAT